MVARAPLQHFFEALEFDVGASRQTILALALNMLGVGFPELHDRGGWMVGAWPTRKDGRRVAAGRFSTINRLEGMKAIKPKPKPKSKS